MTEPYTDISEVETGVPLPDTYMYTGKVETGVPFTGHSLNGLTRWTLDLTSHFV